jgi:hypothetical protein
MIRLPMRDEGSDADDRVVDVFGKLVADRLANFYVGLADKIIGGCEPTRSGTVSRSQTITLGFM